MIQFGASIDNSRSGLFREAPAASGRDETKINKGTRGQKPTVRGEAATIQMTQQLAIEFRPKGGDMTPLEQKVANIIRQKHRGRNNAVARHALVEFTGMNDRLVREVVASLITNHGQPIGTAPKGGYYWIDDPEDIGRMAAWLAKYIVSLAARLRALVGSREAARILGQLDLTGGK